jgi:transposase
MATNSILYHGFGLRGYRYVRTDFDGGAITFTIEPQRLACAACKSRDIVRRGGRTRRWRSLPIGRKPTFLQMDLPRVECRNCGAIRQIHIAFAAPRRQHTRAFARLVIDLAESMTLRDVACFLGIGWDTVKDIVKRDLDRRFGKPQLRDLRRIAIDEIAVRKGHRYLTIVADLDSGAVVFVGDGKGADALNPFFARLRRSGARVEAVAMDFSTAYQKAAREHLPDAAIVFDRFHVTKLFNEKLSGLRRELHREATDQMQKKVLKGSRWLLFKRPWNLDDARDERQRLHDALALNQPLATAYYLKEELDLLWQQPDRRTAARFLKGWLERAMQSGIRILQQMARTLATRRHGLLDWYRYPISTGPLEGINNKIKTLKRQAYGFRDADFFRLRIYALHRTRFQLVG